MATVNEIIDFWFEGVTDESPLDKNKLPFRKWFVKNDAFDNEIREKFEADIIKAKNGEYRKWGEAALGRLALILLFDQFPRNIYRNTPKAFAFDPLALDLTLRSLSDGFDRQLSLIHRVFVYMPLQHAENLAHQKESLRKFEKLVDESKIKNPKNTHYFEYHLSFARKHFEIIEQSGRFPHRNKILGRPSTPEESSFLKKS